MIGDIIEIERAKRTTFEPTSERPPGDAAEPAARANDSDTPQSGFATLIASVRDRLGQFKIRLD